MDNDIYWIWLQKALGATGNHVRYILDRYSSIKEFYNAGEKEWARTGIFTTNRIKRLKSTKLQICENIIKNCYRQDQTIVTPESKLYPQRLKNIYNPPAVLYIKGSMPESLDDKVCITIVGTRSATEYGMRVAFNLASSLAKSGVIIISGGAVGIDTASLKGALKSNGITICVLGCSIEYNYLSENKNLRHLVAKNGAIISEYPPGTSPAPWNFPVRNRIMSGLSLGVLVVEAGDRSGALITANLAAEQGRDVFAVPGNVTSKYSVGTNNLIKDGVKPVTEYTDILEEYISKDRIERITQNVERKNDSINHIKKSENIKEIQQKKNIESILERISPKARSVYNVLIDQPQHIDLISYKTKLSSRETLIAITELELNCIVKSYSGRRYARI